MELDGSRAHGKYCSKYYMYTENIKQQRCHAGVCEDSSAVPRAAIGLKRTKEALGMLGKRRNLG